MQNKTTKNIDAFKKKRVKFKKLPILTDKIQQMYNTPLNLENLQNQAQKHYKTSKLGNLLRVECKVMKKVCTINFTTDELGYMLVQPFKNGLPTAHAFNFKCTYNRDLFIKLRTYKIL